MEKIIIKDASENNLKHLDLEIPLDKFTCVTGCSGCGKSSLVFDTIYAESQRAFLEGMTGNIYGQKLMNKPKVGSIENLRPALNISQNYYNVNPVPLSAPLQKSPIISDHYFPLLIAAKHPAFQKNCSRPITQNLLSSLLWPRR